MSRKQKCPACGTKCTWWQTTEETSNGEESCPSMPENWCSGGVGPRGLSWWGLELPVENPFREPVYVQPQVAYDEDRNKWVAYVSLWKENSEQIGWSEVVDLFSDHGAAVGRADEEAESTQKALTDRLAGLSSEAMSAIAETLKHLLETQESAIRGAMQEQP